MTTDYLSWSGPARTMALAVETAVSAAQAGDLAAFTDSVADLIRADHGQIAVLLGAVTRDLIERSHPYGLDSGDAERLLQSCLRSAGPWYTPLELDKLIRALTGSLGMSDPEETTKRDGPAVVAHGLLLIADQPATRNQELPTVLECALRELMRAQTVEPP